MGEGTALLIGAALILANAFFVGAEFALISVRRTQIQPAADAGSKRARATVRAMRQVSLMMAGAQLGITLCTLGLGALTEPALAALLEPGLYALGVPEALVHPIAMVPALLVVIALHVVIGEMVPKNIALAEPERSALVLGPILAGMVRIARPVVVGLNAIANGVLRLVRVEPRDEVAVGVGHEEVGLLLAESRREGLIDHEQHDRTAEALAFVERRVAEAMISLDEVISIDADSTPADVEELATRTGYSRFPRYGRDGLLSGYIHLRDVLSIPGALRDRPVPLAWVRPLPVVTIDAALADVVGVLRGSGSHAARVDATEGTVAGVITLDGILLRLIPHRPGSRR